MIKVSWYKATRKIYFVVIVLSFIQLSGCTLPLSPITPRQHETTCEDERLKEKYEREVEELWCLVKEGDLCAMTEIGDRYLLGKGVCKDLCKAFSWYKKAAESGLAAAQHRMGDFYRDAIAVDRDICEAVLWYERAAQQGYTASQLALANLYKGYAYFKPDLNKALFWYERASENGSIKAKLEIARLYGKGVCGSEGYKKAYEILFYLAEQCKVYDAYADIGDLYLTGCKGPIDYKLAEEYYEKAYCKGSPMGAFKLGMLYQTGLGVPLDVRKGFLLILFAADRGYIPAEYYLGDIFFYGRGPAVDKKKAAHWYTMAMNHGYYQAEIKLADMYLSGRGMPRILEKAAEHYRNASELSCDPYATLMLSTLYELGRGVCFSLEESQRLFWLAAREPGFLNAMYRIGKNFETGYGLPKDYYLAQKWFILAAEKGNLLSELELGDLYYRGKGPINTRRPFEVGGLTDNCFYLNGRIKERCGDGEGIEQNYGKAFYWYSKAAQKRDPYAQFMIGIMYLYGQGVKENCLAAVNWIRKAAYQCAREAQYQMGLLYLEGRGVPQSDSKAYAWFKIALDEMMEGTPREIEALVCDMGPKQKAEAVRLAKEYEKKYCPTPGRRCISEYAPLCLDNFRESPCAEIQGAGM